MQRLTFYRGIAVAPEEASAIEREIRHEGILTGKGAQWNFRIPDIPTVRKAIDDLFETPNLSATDFVEPEPHHGVCACGTERSAAFYATKHNVSGSKTHALIIEFTADLNDAYVDCRDFLCSAFQLWDRKTSAHRLQQSAVLAAIFGDGIVRYFNEACDSPEQARRIAMANLSCFDASVVVSHHANRHIVGGRHSTLFDSAFMVKAPISADRIIRVGPPSASRASAADISLDAFLDQGDMIQTKRRTERRPT